MPFVALVVLFLVYVSLKGETAGYIALATTPTASVKK